MLRKGNPSFFVAFCDIINPIIFLRKGIVMKKGFKILLIWLGFLLLFFTVDTIQAKVFDNCPLIKITKTMDDSNFDRLDIGVFTKTYYCFDGTQKTIFKWKSYACPIETNYIDSNPTHSKITWDEITETGVDEELLLQNIDIDVLNQVGRELQTLVDEAYEEERENPEIIFTEGWARILEYDCFKKVVDIGVPAMKPLYLIIYKSQNRGVYEYLCAYALYQISGYDFFWSTTDEFMEKFNAQILAEKVSEQ